MSFLHRFLSNHVLVNLTFVLVIVFGLTTYLQMPRSRFPEINFNWVNIITVFPGAAATDVERRVTDPLEHALRTNIRDIRYALSTSREGISHILLQLNELDQDTFDKRLNDISREAQNTYLDKLPAQAENPIIYELNSSSASPAARVVVTSPGDDENLHQQTLNIIKSMARIKGAGNISVIGRSDPELHVAFMPERLQGLGITPADIIGTVRGYFRDMSAGDLETEDGKWVVRLQSTGLDPSALRDLPIITATRDVVPLGALAELRRARQEPETIIRFRGAPAALLSVNKQTDANVLELVDRIKQFIAERNSFKQATGVEMFLVDDQTTATRNSLNLMQDNAAIGFIFVLLVTWLFLGPHIAFFTSIGIFFTIAGAFLVVNACGFSLSNTVLIGIVIALGMIVDDAVVVVEAIYLRLRQGLAGMRAIDAALAEVFAPVTTSVLTTIAAFLPLMLLPGVLGGYMQVIPLVVCVALAVSLIEAYWILPSHVLAVRADFSRPGFVQRKRVVFTGWIRRRYVMALLYSLRHPLVAAAGILLVVLSTMGALASGKVRFNFFADDLKRIFFLNVEMPRGSSLENTAGMLSVVEQAALETFLPGELDTSVAIAGYQFTNAEPVHDDILGQVMFNLNPPAAGIREVSDIGDEILKRVKSIPGPSHISILELKDGAPPRKPVHVKIMGDDYASMLPAALEMREFLEAQPAYRNISMDYRPGNPELVLQLDGEAIQRAGLNPGTVRQALRTFIDGEVVSGFHHLGEEVKIRVLAKRERRSGIDNLLAQTISLPGGKPIPLGELVRTAVDNGQQNLRHYNFQRAIALESDLDKSKLDTLQANKLILDAWTKIQDKYPALALDLSGEMDDIQESLEALRLLALLGLGIIYIILGTQFRSYFQPFMVMATVPLALTGVTLGLLVTQNALSLFTLYGIVALTGISVNAAIILISAANSRLEDGMSLTHATIYAARRRVIPILITSLTTIVGLLPLTLGLAGKSVIWGSVATAIVWGLAFSTILTLFVVPLLFRTFMAYSPRSKSALHLNAE